MKPTYTSTLIRLASITASRSLSRHNSGGFWRKHTNTIWVFDPGFGDTHPINFLNFQFQLQYLKCLPLQSLSRLAKISKLPGHEFAISPVNAKEVDTSFPVRSSCTVPPNAFPYHKAPLENEPKTYTLWILPINCDRKAFKAL